MATWIVALATICYYLLSVVLLEPQVEASKTLRNVSCVSCLEISLCGNEFDS